LRARCGPRVLWAPGISETEGNCDLGLNSFATGKVQRKSKRRKSRVKMYRTKGGKVWGEKERVKTSEWFPKRRAHKATNGINQSEALANKGESGSGGIYSPSTLRNRKERCLISNNSGRVKLANLVARASRDVAQTPPYLSKSTSK